MLFGEYIEKNFFYKSYKFYNHFIYWFTLFKWERVKFKQYSKCHCLIYLSRLLREDN